MDTIDDALEGLPVDGKDKRIKSAEEKNSETLVIRAREIMGPVLVKYLNGELDGQLPLTKKLDDPMCIKLILELGLELLMIYPDKEIRSIGIRMSTNFSYTLNEEDIKRVLSIIGGNYILETDLFDLHKTNFGLLNNTLPELISLRDNFLLPETRATLNPYIIVMGMKPENRALATLAVENAIADNVFPIMPDYVHVLYTGAQLEKILYSFSPRTIDYVKVAEEFHIKGIKDVIEDYNKSYGMYKGRWK